MNNDSSKNPSSSHDKTRRNIIKGLASTSLLSLFPTFNVIADSLRDDVPDAFVSVSKALTQRDVLPEMLVQRFYQALQATHRGFAQQVMTLEQEMNQFKTQNFADKLSPESQQTAKTILSAWYTGIVGDGPEAQVVTYRNAFEFSAVEEVLTPRSYCPNKPGFWAAKPMEKNA
ncbi:sugar dehydrogenase complex small subunit [Vibrio palustris]|uniref:Fructose dehydrogenase small subunit n=1 Tax=Vibrio palustris TaxID=1918946 RepID=A0A1R4B4U3_9VIBR|nr:sugar dehydrogenase complex small subunit [Vibrio palustris]SJL83911.1 Fructose dehydrogenase small subunit precursor [Vibrio palustris]